eukprot:1614332-Amphidinium_carterae.1
MRHHYCLRFGAKLGEVKAQQHHLGRSRKKAPIDRCSHSRGEMPFSPCCVDLMPRAFAGIECQNAQLKLHSNSTAATL